MSLSSFQSHTTSFVDEDFDNERKMSSKRRDVAPSEEKIRQEEIEYDRRQIRKKLRDKLLERGAQDDATLVEVEEYIDEDAESVYEDLDLFPWQQREAAVLAATVDGQTEGRVEGFDSLERALQADHQKSQYARGAGFGWSQPHSTVMANQKSSTGTAARDLTDWTSFDKLNPSSASVSTVSGSAKLSSFRTNSQESVGERHAKRSKQLVRNTRLLNTFYICIAITVVIGFVYYIESLKVGNYRTQLPEGYIPLVASQSEGGSEGNTTEPATGAQRSRMAKLLDSSTYADSSLRGLAANGT